MVLGEAAVGEAIAVSTMPKDLQEEPMQVAEVRGGTVDLMQPGRTPARRLEDRDAVVDTAAMAQVEL